MSEKCEAAEYKFISERLREWEEIYAQDEHHRERDIRDDMLALYRRALEIQLTTIFELQSKVYGVTTPARSTGTPFPKGELLARLERLEARVTALEGAFFGLVDRVIDELVGLTNAVVRRGRNVRN